MSAAIGGHIKISYVAYPLGMKGVVVGEGETYEEAFADVTSANAFHIETFGPGTRNRSA